MRICLLALITAISLMSFGCSLRSEIAEARQPSFTQAEANAKVGERVRFINRYSPHRSGILFPVVSEINLRTGFLLEYANPRAGKRLAGGGPDQSLVDGETGTVTGTIPVRDGGYFVVVSWDDARQDSPLISYFGRKTYRVFLSQILPSSLRDSLQPLGFELLKRYGYAHIGTLGVELLD